MRIAAAFAATALAVACTSDFDCQLNGKCAAGTCACRPGWTGFDCGQLDFKPAPTTPAFFRPTVATWGGSIIQDSATGQFNMFFASMEGHCGLNSWQPNSAIYHAVSSTDSPLGPYVNETKILDWFSHNPTVSKQPDGTLLLWHIGCGSNGGGFVTGCTNGTTPPPPPPPPVKFQNGGKCLISSGTYPCWQGGPDNSFEVCPLITGSCDDVSSQWSIEGNTFVSYPNNPAAINIDCNSCTPGSVAKLFSDGGSGITFNATTGQIEVDSCPGMCLSNGIATGTNKPCGGGSEPYLPNQIHVVPCSSPDTQGWSKVANEAADAAAAHSAPRPLQDLTSSWPAPCTDVNVLVSQTGLNGPWTQTGILQGLRKPFPYETDNPAPLVFPNGTTWVMFRSWNPPGNTTTPIGIARSDGPTWNTTYTLTANPVPRGFYNQSGQPAVYVPLEDPFMWQDAESGTWHAVYHNMGGCKSVGCHAFSADGFNWYLATSDAYTTTIQFADGSNKTLSRRERPHLVFNSQGQPAFLSNGVLEQDMDDHSYTLVQPINVSFP